MNTVLVTGGAGFVGSCLALGLKAYKPALRVLALDNLKRRGSEMNLSRLREGGVEFVHGDIRNPEDLEVAGDIGLILECSAEPSVLAGYTSSPGYVVNTNLCGTINCLEVARRQGAAIIFLSTSRVYPIETLNALSTREEASRFELNAEQPMAGASEKGIAEDFPLEGRRSLYGATKLCSEYIMQEYLAMYGLKGVINRCGLIAGPWQMGKADQGVVVLWAARHVFGGTLTYLGYGGQGKQVRDMVHVDDVLRLVLYQIDHLDSLAGETFNVGGGRTVSASLQELTAYCREVTGNTIEITGEAEERTADIRLYITDHTRVSSRCGWHPEKDVRTIIEDIVNWIEAHKERLRPILC